MARSISHHDGFKNISIRPKAAQALTVAPNERHVANMTIEEAANAREEAEVEGVAVPSHFRKTKPDDHGGVGFPI